VGSDPAALGGGKTHRGGRIPPNLRNGFPASSWAPSRSGGPTDDRTEPVQVGPGAGVRVEDSGFAYCGPGSEPSGVCFGSHCPQGSRNHATRAGDCFEVGFRNPRVRAVAQRAKMLGNCLDGRGEVFPGYMGGWCYQRSTGPRLCQFSFDGAGNTQRPTTRPRGPVGGRWLGGPPFTVPGNIPHGAGSWKEIASALGRAGCSVS